MIDILLDWIEDQRYATKRLSSAMAQQISALPTGTRFLFGVLVLLIAWLVLAVQQQQQQIDALPDLLRPVQAVVATATTAPIPTSSTQQEVALHTTTNDPRPRLPFDTIAYGAPDPSTAFNTVRAGSPYTTVERSGPDWMRIDIGEREPNLIWVQVSALTGAATVPDIATATPAPEGVYVSAPAVPPSAPAQVQQPPATVDAPAVYSASCAGQEEKTEGGITWVCAIGKNDGKIYWLPKTPLDQAQAQAVQPTSAPNPVQYNLVQNADGSTVSRAVIAPNATRFCTGFGDARDYDPNYSQSPVCKPPQVASK